MFKGEGMKRTVCGTMLALLVLSMLTLALNIQQAKSQQSTTLKIVDAATGSSSITIGSETEPIPKGGIPFTVKIVLEGGVTNLLSYQVGIIFDPTAINCTNAYNPKNDPNYIFYGKDLLEAKDIDNAEGEVVIGAALLSPADAVTTDGGILCIINFTSLKAGTFTLNFETPWNTFLLNTQGLDIPFQTQSFTLTVKGFAMPSASFTWTPTYPKANETVTFDASASYDLDGYIVNYIWDFGDGVITETINPIITHNFTKNGMYNVNLTVIDNDGLKDSIVHIVNVGCPPILILEPLNPKYMPNEEITFNASRSYDPDGYIVSYIWDFGDGQNKTTTDPITNKTYTKRGIYTVAIKIVDDDGLYNSATLKIQIGNSPIANFTYTPKNPKVGEEVTFDASNTTLPDRVPLKTYVWHIEEGNKTIIKDASEGPLFIYTFTKSDPGWNVTLTVIDEDGLYSSCSALVPVYAEKVMQTIYIRADGRIDPPDAPIITYDNVTYTLTGNITSNADGIVVERDNITIDGAMYTVHGTGEYAYKGIDLMGRSNVMIKNIRITAFLYGIYFNFSTNNIIVGNNITANWDGIDLNGSLNNSIIGNSVMNNEYSIYLFSSSNNIIIGNNITNSFEGILFSYSSNNSIIGNNISNNIWYSIYLEHSSNNSISGNSVTNNKLFDGIHLYGSSNNSIFENNITNNRYAGIYLQQSSNNSIFGNVFVANGLVVDVSFMNVVEGNTVNGKPLVYLESVSNFTVADAGQVVLVKCENIRVENLNLSAATIGVELWETSNTIISGNSITANNRYGILLFQSFNNSISGNSITNNKEGIWLEYHSFNSIIIRNSITNNQDGGIILSESSNNIIVENNITNNHCGIVLGLASNNKVFHNNFINNTHQADSRGSINTWDDGYPSGGNYWSDYAGVDLYSGPYQNLTGNDGIGDTQYTIDANNVDSYPLMAPFKAFEAGVWDGTAYNVDVLSNSTVSDFKFNVDNKSISFNVSGDDGTIGFCRVTIPKSLLWVDDGWTILVDSQSITDCTKFEDENFTYLYFTYTHSTKTVTIKGTNVIPEFPSTMLELLMVTTLVTTILLKKKTTKRKLS